MNIRLKIALLLSVGAAAVLWHREILRAVRAWGEAMNRLFQTDLEAYAAEDPTLSLVPRPTMQPTAAPAPTRQTERIGRARAQLQTPEGAVPFGAFWNWVRRTPVRRAIHRNGRHSQRSAS
jgi:hypothetical protein